MARPPTSWPSGPRTTKKQRDTWKGMADAWRIIPIYKPFRPFVIVRGPTTRSLGDLLTMVINHLLTGMILQVVP